MVSIQSYDVLRNLKKLANNTETELAIYMDRPIICIDCDDEKQMDFSKYDGEIYGIIEDLVSSGHLTYTRKGVYYFSLTAKGIHPFQGVCARIINFLLKSIAVPIVVSLLTTLFALKIFGTI